MAPRAGRRSVSRHLLRNAARCLACGTEVESRLPDDVMSCTCGALTISGGLVDPYLAFRARPGGGYEDLSVTVEVLDGGADESSENEKGAAHQ